MRVFVIILFAIALKAQEIEVYSVYFDTDKFELKPNHVIEVLNFINENDSTTIENINIYGYCDDRGKASYNLELSQNRANAVKELLINNGITNKIIVNIEGKGRVLLDEDTQGDVIEMRSKNRRVDVMIEKKAVPVEEVKIPGIYHEISDNHVVGDRIYLKNLYFEIGSSKLIPKTVKELTKLSALMRKYPQYHFEIQGHICCTPKKVKEAIDKDTKKRELSINRAKNVYNFLIKKSVKRDRLSYKGLGNTQPLGQNKALDRRVELVITKIEQ